MAHRIHEHIVRGEVDNRTRGRVTGTLWLEGRAEPVSLDLQGNPWRDLAGLRLRFSNPRPKPGPPEGLQSLQKGQAGDITASRKVKVPDCSSEWISTLRPHVEHTLNEVMRLVREAREGLE